ncbi:hypothetical protein [Aeromicrobium sp. Sec7.5]|uniref:hypothetical protein n=1 Tax=Aeromicrobium sp. Sec7.5 TaxID=3121276 RepID=UPI002FE4E63A
MQETKRIGLELWVGLWAIAGLTALCLAMVGAGWHHLLIGLVAFALAYAPVRIGAEVERRRPATAEARAAAATPLAIVADDSDGDSDGDSDEESSSSQPRRDVDQVA